MAKQALPLLILRAIWSGLDRLRRVLHLVLLLGLFLVLLGALVGQQIVVPRSAALVIAPQGVIVDQLSGDALDRAIARGQGTAVAATVVRGGLRQNRHA